MVTELAESEHPPSSEIDFSSLYESERVPEKALQCWKILLDHTEEELPVPSILDIGCGRGDFLDLARDAGLRTAGMEISEGARDTARAKGHQVVLESISATPYPSGERFGIVTMWDILEHLDQPGTAIRNAWASLVPGGRILILSPMMSSFYDRAGLFLYRASGGSFDKLLRMCWDRNHRYRFHRRGITGAMRRIGFEDLLSAPLLLLSLKPDSYAGGGNILWKWTGNRGIDRSISRAGCALARLLRLHNKILVTAKRSAH